MAVIAMDFDHVLVDGETPKQGAREAINILREHGHKVMIHSANNRAWIERVLNNADIRYDSLWVGVGKPAADLYVDDRGYDFKGDWSVSLGEILEHRHVKGKDNRKW